METLVSSLNLHDLDSSYSNALWNNGFSADEPGLPEYYVLHLHTIPLENTLSSLSQGILTGLSNGTLKHMQSLKEIGFDLKRMLCLVHYLLSCNTESLNEENGKLALAGVRFYLSLLAVSDSHVYPVFHCHLYSKALKFLTLTFCFEKDFSKQSKRKSDNQEKCDMQPQISNSVPNELQSSVRLALKDLITSLQVGSFCQRNGAVDITAEVLLNVIEHESSIIFPLHFWSNAHFHQGRSLSFDAFLGLLSLCNSCDVNVKESTRIIMKFVFDLMQRSFQKEFSKEQGNILRENTCNFVHFVVEELGSDSHHAVLILIQFLCLHCPDRADPRYKLVEKVFSLLMKFRDDLFISSVCLIIELSCKEKSVALRHFTTSLTGKLLMVTQDQWFDCVERFTEKKNIPDFPVHLHKFCLIALLSRLQDASFNVVAKALCIFADYLDKRWNIFIIQENLQSLFITPYENVETVDEVPCNPLKHVSDISRYFKKKFVIKSHMIPCGHTIMKELLDCVSDDKVLVRKGALQCIIRIFQLNGKFMSKDALKIISRHCHDKAINIRKNMVEEFTDLLLCYPSHEQLAKEWCLNVLPLIVDTESKVVEKVAQNIARAVLENLVEEASTISAKQQLPWLLMSFISDLQLKKFFMKACVTWDESVLRPRRLVSVLKSYIGTGKTHNTIAWMMLMCFAESISIEDPIFVLNFYHTEVHNIPNVSTYLSQMVIEVLWLSWKHLPSSDKKSLEEELSMDLVLFKMPVFLISRAVDIRHGLYKELNNIPSDEKLLQVLPPWAVELTKKCEESIVDMLRASHEHVQDEEVMQRFVCTLGNTVIYCPGVVQTSTVQQLQCMLRPTTGLHENYWSGSCSTEMKAGLIITLGKLSLQNEKRAQELLHVLGPLLKETNESLLKNNIMVCLTDLCIRYASLVEGLLPEMCICLKDEQRSVRENTLVLLIQLLQEDYLKMKEKLLFYLLTMLNDPDFILRAMTRTFFIDSVLPKYKKLLCSRLTHAVFHYNRYKVHQRYSGISMTKQEEKTFNISGARNMALRCEIYRFVLSMLEEESRMVISQLLCIDICKGVVDKDINLDESGQCVLKDALFVMSCEEMRHSDKKDDDARLDLEEIENQVLSVRKEAVSAMKKRHIVEVEVPTMIALYGKLITQAPHLTKDVIRNLRLLMEEEKLDPTEILKGEDVKILKKIKLALKSALSVTEGSDEDCDSPATSENEETDLNEL